MEQCGQVVEINTVRPLVILSSLLCQDYRTWSAMKLMANRTELVAIRGNTDERKLESDTQVITHFHFNLHP